MNSLHENEMRCGIILWLWYSCPSPSQVIKNVHELESHLLRINRMHNTGTKRNATVTNVLCNWCLQTHSRRSHILSLQKQTGFFSPMIHTKSLQLWSARLLQTELSTDYNQSQFLLNVFIVYILTALSVLNIAGCNGPVSCQMNCRTQAAWLLTSSFCGCLCLITV